MCWGHTDWQDMTTCIPAEGETRTHIPASHLQPLPILPPETQHGLPSAPARLKEKGGQPPADANSMLYAQGQKAKKRPQETTCSQPFEAPAPLWDAAPVSLPPGNTIPGTLTEGLGGGVLSQGIF